VLAFDNLSNDSEQEYFSDGIAEDIITELTRFRELFVIARNSSFVFKGRKADILEIGRQLGVGYVIEGSVRKAGSRVRISAQLIDAKTGSHMWAERYDRDLEDIFAVQDEVVGAVVSRVAGHLRHRELAQIERKTPADLKAYELTLRAHSFNYQGHKQSVAEAILLLERALEIDPDYPLATAALGISHFLNACWRWSPDPDTSRDRSLTYLRRAIELDDTSHVAHWLLSDVYLYGYKNLANARVHAERAFVLNPNASDALGWLGFVRCVEGNYDEGIALANEAIRLDPLVPGFNCELLGNCHYLAGNYTRAIEVYNAINLDFNSPPFYLAAAYQATEETGLAHESAQFLISTLSPEMESPPDNWLEYMSWESGIVREQDLDKFESRLRMAGIPDGPYSA